MKSIPDILRALGDAEVRFVLDVALAMDEANLEKFIAVEAAWSM